MTVTFGTLISVGDLAGHLNDSDWCVVDCRHDLANPAFGREAYLDGHIPGALFLPLDEDLSGPRTGANGRHPLPDPIVLAGRLGACGIGRNTQVVAYDDAGGMYAARLWALLRWLGHDRVAVLDGGYRAWCDDARPVTGHVRQPTPCEFEARIQPMMVSVAEVLSHLNEPSMLIVDARSPDRFRGENETLDPVGGHIPGAINRFFRDNLAADGRFKPAAELRSAFISVLAGREPGSLVHQCGSGVTACHNLLAMEHAGLPGSRLYAGSWSEWCADPGRPIAGGT